MAKLESARDTVQVAAGATTLSLPVKGATTIFQGSIVALDESGFAVPGSKAENLKAVGRAEETVENTGADGDIRVNVARGVFIYENSTEGAIADADVLGPCYIEDDQTVTKTAEGASVAGLVVGVDADGVAVEMGFGYSPAGAAAPAAAAGKTKLSELEDVEISGEEDAQVLTYDRGSSKWKNKAAASEAV